MVAMRCMVHVPRCPFRDPHRPPLHRGHRRRWFRPRGSGGSQADGVEGVRRRCIEHGCNELTAHTRCPRHERAYRAAYHGDYEERRKAVIGGPCMLGLPGCTGIATTADHVTPVVAGGARGELRGSCAHCNSSRGDGSRGTGGEGARENGYRTAQDPRTSFAMRTGSQVVRFRP